QIIVAISILLNPLLTSGIAGNATVAHTVSIDDIQLINEAIVFNPKAVVPLPPHGGHGGNEGGNDGGNHGGNDGGNDGGNRGGNDGGNRGGNDGGNRGGNDGGNRGGNDGGNNGNNDGGNNGNNDGGNNGGNDGGNTGGPVYPPPTCDLSASSNSLVVGQSVT